MAQSSSELNSPSLSEPPSESLLTLYHRPFSRSGRVLWALGELEKLYGKPEKGGFRFHVHELPEDFRETKPQWYLQLNPNGKVPFLVDPETGTSFFESCAIVLYLAEKYDVDGKLSLSHDDPHFFKSHLYQWAFYAAGTVDNLVAHTSPIQRAVVALDPTNLESGRAPENLKKARLAWDTVVGPLLEKEVKLPFFMGDNFSLVDIVLGRSLLKIYEQGRGKKDVGFWLEEGGGEFPRLWSYLKALVTQRRNELEKAHVTRASLESLLS